MEPKSLFNSSKKRTLKLPIIAVSIISISILSAFFFLVAGMYYEVSKNSSVQLALNQLDVAFKNFKEYSVEYFHSGEIFLETAALSLKRGEALAETGAEESMELLFATISLFPNLNTAYFAGENGEFFMVKKMTDGSVSRLKAIDSSGKKKYEWTHANPAFYRNFPNFDEDSGKGFKPKERVWYREAREKNTTVMTEPYSYFYLDYQIGISIAKPIHFDRDGDGVAELIGVLGVDFNLAHVSDKLNQLLEFSNIGEIAFVLDLNKRILALSGTEEKTYPANRFNKKDTLKLESLSETSNPFLKKIDFKDHLNYQDINRGFLSYLIFPQYKKTLRFFGFDEAETGVPEHDLKFHSFEHGDGVYLYALSDFYPLAGGSKYFIGFLLSEDSILGEINSALRLISIITFLIILSLVFLFACLSRSIANTMGSLSSEMQRIRERLDIRSDRDNSSWIKEINQMADSFESMKRGLYSFLKYVPSELVCNLVRQGKEAVVGGEKKMVTLFFSDIEGFSQISAGQEPQVLMENLSYFLGKVSGVIGKHEGTLDKFIGDGVMAFWGVAVEDKDHERLACLAALECQKAIEKANGEMKAKGFPPFKTRIGLNTGEVVVGNLGSDERLNYTAIGDHVNLASRLEGINKFYGTKIIISENTLKAVQEFFETRLLDKVSVKGRNSPLLIHELLCQKGELGEIQTNLKKKYEAAVRSYFAGDWDAALKLFQSCLDICEEDGPSRAMLLRCEEFLKNPPDENWDGVFRFRSK